MLMQSLDVLIGLTVLYLVFSTVASAGVELVEAVVRRRGSLLMRGIDELFKAAQLRTDKDEPLTDVAELVTLFYNSPHIASLYRGSVELGADAAWQVKNGRLPSYIPAERFAGALLNLAEGKGLPAELGAERAKAAQENFRRITEVALSLYSRTTDAGAATLDAQRARIAAYFEATGDRLSGWYRRYVQWILFTIGLTLAVVLNVDTVRIATVLSQDPELRAHIVEQALDGAASGALAPPACASGMDASECEEVLRGAIVHRMNLAKSTGLPLGWSGDPLIGGSASSFAAWLQKVVGLTITALAVCLGAPFWFNLLNNLASVRNTLKPPPPDKPVAGERT